MTEIEKNVPGFSYVGQELLGANGAAYCCPFRGLLETLPTEVRTREWREEAGRVAGADGDTPRTSKWGVTAVTADCFTFSNTTESTCGEATSSMKRLRSK